MKTGAYVRLMIDASIAVGNLKWSQTMNEICAIRPIINTSKIMCMSLIAKE